MIRPAKTHALEIRAVDDGVLVYDAMHEKIHVLNPTAAFILQRCDGTRTLPDLARLLAAAAGAEHTTVTVDVARVLREFAALELLAQ